MLRGLLAQRRERTICVDSNSSCDSMRSRHAKNFVDAKKLGSSVELRRPQSGSLLFAAESLREAKSITASCSDTFAAEQLKQVRCSGQAHLWLAWLSRSSAAKACRTQLPTADQGLHAFPRRRS